MENNSSLFFSDGEKIIDFILVYNAYEMSEDALAKLELFLDNLRRAGLDLEIESFTADMATTFVKIHCAKDILIRYADICDIDLAYRSLDYLASSRPAYSFMGTPLTIANSDDSLYERAPEAIPGSLPDDVTTAERIMVVYKVLNKTKFGRKHSDYGIEKLVKEKVFLDYFPLHEGPFEWSEDGPLTDRQLLAKFWGSPNTWYKEQPLDLIEKYFGPEYAFYFAWLGVYVKMLIPAAILSILCIIFGLITMNNTRSEEICNSNITMCPRCHYKHCKYEKLSNSCVSSYLTYLFDNPATITFAILISFWSTVFMEIWERQEAVLQLHWNVKSLEHDMSMRPEYIETAQYTKISRVTGEREPYVPMSIIIARYAITLASVALMLVIIILAMLGVMVYRTTVSLMLVKSSKEDEIIEENVGIIASMTGSFMSACSIIIFTKIYTKVALMLTNMENHRTQYQFDHSYIFKTYALAFTNNYSAVFYIAFFKGRFFTHPGDVSVWTNLGGLGSDICDPTGCILDLSVQLMFIMLLKIFVNNFMQIVYPLLIEKYNRLMNKVTASEDMPLYEKEYLMAPTGRYFLIDEYMDMVIQYGFVVFFVAGFPLAPVLAFVNNVIEVKVDAYKITRSFRRPIPNKVPGLGAWFGILQGMTYLGVVTNALVVAFTSDFVMKEIYRYNVDSSLKGFVNSTISAFLTSDFNMTNVTSISNTPNRPSTPIAPNTPITPNAPITPNTLNTLNKSIISTRSNISNVPSELPLDVCFYPGKRYPPEHENKYKLTTDYWFVLAVRFLVVVIFEHIVMIIKGILAYAIPDVPTKVTEQLAIQEKEDKELRMKALDEQYKKEKKTVRFEDVVDEEIL